MADVVRIGEQLEAARTGDEAGQHIADRTAELRPLGEGHGNDGKDQQSQAGEQDSRIHRAFAMAHPGEEPVEQTAETTQGLSRIWTERNTKR